jgi:hypothetical protein
VLIRALLHLLPLLPFFSDGFPVERFQALAEERIIDDFVAAIRQDLFARPEAVSRWRSTLRSAFARQRPAGRPIDRDFSGRPVHYGKVKPVEQINDVTSEITLGCAVGVLGWRDTLMSLNPSLFQRRHMVTSVNAEPDAADLVRALEARYARQPRLTRFGYFDPASAQRHERLLWEEEISRVRQASLDLSYSRAEGPDPRSVVVYQMRPCVRVDVTSEAVEYARFSSALMAHLAPPQPPAEAVSGAGQAAGPAVAPVRATLDFNPRFAKALSQFQQVLERNPGLGARAPGRRHYKIAQEIAAEERNSIPNEATWIRYVREGLKHEREAKVTSTPPVDVRGRPSK